MTRPTAPHSRPWEWAHAAPLGVIADLMDRRDSLVAVRHRPRGIGGWV